MAAPPVAAGSMSDLVSFMKFKVISSMSDGPAGSGTGGSKSTMLMLMLLPLGEELIRGFNPVFAKLRERMMERLVHRPLENAISVAQRDPPLQDNGISLGIRHHVNIVQFRRRYGSSVNSRSQMNGTSGQPQEHDNSLVDGILDHAASQLNIPSFVVKNNVALVSFKDKPVEIDRSVFLRIDQVLGADGDKDELVIEFALLSNTLSASELLEWAQHAQQRYKIKLANSLGNDLWYFEQKSEAQGRLDPRPIPGQSYRDMKIAKLALERPRLTFTKTLFKSNKRFENLFGEQAREAERRVRWFMDKPQWYADRGLPHQLGILLR